MRQPSDSSLVGSSEAGGKCWTILTANTTAWSSAQGMLEQLASEGLAPDIVGLQETRLADLETCFRARAWAASMGYRLSMAPAVSTGPGLLQSSAGVALGCRARIGFAAATSIPGTPAFSSRVLAGHIEGILAGGITLASVYLKDGIGLQHENIDILWGLGQYFNSFEEPYIVFWRLEHGARPA